jgi:tRNA-2-methylthio-N6-dimethylallyladenosine synthase
MNVYDSARMADVLAPLGYAPVDEPADADMVILNTCHIREKAAEKLYSELGRLRPLKQRPADRGGPVCLVVAGCVAQAEGEELKARAPFVDIVVGPQAYHRLPELVARASRARGGALDTDFPARPKFDDLPQASSTTSPGTQFITVQEGCDRFCTFCVVPYTRGAEYSRPVADVLAEVRRAVALGAREITLLGQNVNAWHGDGPDGRPWRLGRLIRTVADIDLVERIRYTTSHPVDMDRDLITAHGEVPQLMPFLHLPVQSGSDRVLKAMNRRHRRTDYLGIIEDLRAARPDMALGSDFIVGYPGETDADFRDTLALVDHVGYAQAYSFAFSPRPGTPASLEPEVEPMVRKSRLAELQARIVHHQNAFNARTVGRRLPVLFDRPGRHSGQLLGRSPYQQAVSASVGREVLGSIVDVRIKAAGPNSLAGSVIDPRVAA